MLDSRLDKETDRDIYIAYGDKQKFFGIVRKGHICTFSKSLEQE